MLKKILLILTILFLIVNTFIITNYTIEERRVSRLLTVLIYTIIFASFKGFSKNKLITLVILIFLSTDVIGFFLENPNVIKIIYILRIIGYFLLIKCFYKKVKLVRVKPLVFIIFSTVIVFNLYLLYVLVESATRNSKDYVEYFLILFYGITVVVITFMGANYNLRYNTKRSTFMFYSILGFVLSDLSWFSAYFLKYTALFYVDALFYFLGLSCVILYAIDTKESEDVLLAEH